MSTLSEPAHPRAGTPQALSVPIFTAEDSAAIARTGQVVAELLADLVDCELSRAGACWSWHEHPADRLRCLNEALDQVHRAVCRARGDLNRLDRAARRRAARTPVDAAVIGQGWSPCR